MLKKDRKERDQLEFVSIDALVPKDHILRKIDAAVDFNKIYDFVEDLYCLDNGRTSIDPVMLFKMTLIQHIFGISSLRKTAEEVRMNIGYRWIIGYLLNEETPHFSTLSYNFKHRYTPETVEKIFDWILNEINNAGYLSPETAFVDGTHIKANANIKNVVKKEISKAAKIYEKQLMDEINEDREEHGYVVDVTVNAGNVYDSAAFDGLYDKMTEKHPEIETVVMDAGYKTPWICKKVFDDKRIPVLPYKRPMGKTGFFRPYSYIFDEYYDCVLCPEDHVLSYATTNRDGYREFKSKGYQCENCPSIGYCTESIKHEKLVTKHIWESYLEHAEDIRHTHEYKVLYSKRKETIERVFADAKEKHAMRYTNHRGLSQVTNWVRLKFAAMNLKKYAIHRWKELLSCLYFVFFENVFA